MKSVIWQVKINQIKVYFNRLSNNYVQLFTPTVLNNPYHFTIITK